MPQITITISERGLKSLQTELKDEGYTVENPLKLVEILLQNDVVDNLSHHVMEYVLDGGANNLIGDVLNKKEAKACGASEDEIDWEDEENYGDDE